MKLYIAGSGMGERVWFEDEFYDFYRLDSFYTMTDTEKSKVHLYKDFMLDSGAFSFFGKKKVDWKTYTDEYIKFIIEKDIKLFFELDLYSIIGLEETDKLRAYIEAKTGRKSIPVFHARLGINRYKQWCEEYDYVAISASGAYESKWTRSNITLLKKMVLYGRQRGVKIHGLGYTSLLTLKDIKFSSVDSTTWLAGNKYGAIFVFKGDRLIKVNKPIGKKVKTIPALKNNFYEWVKFQNYANAHYR